MSNGLAMDQTVQTYRSRQVILNINSFRLIFLAILTNRFFFPWTIAAFAARLARAPSSLDGVANFLPWRGNERRPNSFRPKVSIRRPTPQLSLLVAKSGGVIPGSDRLLQSCRIPSV
jgi:hypothetical protein